jgi:hypothetical protein
MCTYHRIETTTTALSLQLLLRARNYVYSSISELDISSAYILWLYLECTMLIVYYCYVCVYAQIWNVRTGRCEVTLSGVCNCHLSNDFLLALTACAIIEFHFGHCM